VKTVLVYKKNENILILKRISAFLKEIFRKMAPFIDPQVLVETLKFLTRNEIERVQPTSHIFYGVIDLCKFFDQKKRKTY